MDFMALLAGAEGVFRVRSRDGTARVPEGTYRLMQCRYRCQDTAGKPWDLSARQTEERTKVDVRMHQKGQLRLGPPLVPTVLVSQAGENLNLTLCLRGAGGEVIEDIQRADTHERPPVPKVSITDASDRVLATLDFHYG